MQFTQSVFRAVGSLWFAAVLLVLLLVGMACATVFEAARGTEQALEVFYHSWWFEAVLTLVAVNVAASMLLRYPFSKKLIGFVVTHAAILVVLAGALVTQRMGIDAQVRVAEGQTVGSMNVSNEGTLAITNQSNGAKASIDLGPRVFNGFRVVDQPDVPELRLGEVRISIERYVPDSEWSRRVVADEAARMPPLPPAIKVSLSPSGQDEDTWVLANRAAKVSDMGILFRPIADQAELARLLTEPAPSESQSVGAVDVIFAGQRFEIPVEQCQDQAVPLGDTGFNLRVLRYLPHAVVGADRRLTNASPRPANPAIEVAITGPEQSEKRVCFAKFPGFSHAENAIEDLQVTFVAEDSTTPSTPLEVLRGPNGELHARFSREGTPVVTRELSIGTPVETPWPDRKFAVLECYEHARMEWSLELIDPPREGRRPALLLEVEGAGDTEEVWVQRHGARQVTLGDAKYELAYRNKELPLGFALTLNRFRIGTYPGTNRPRSYESHVDFVDPASGREQSRVISMNHPAEYGGYTFYQSSYEQRREGNVSFLSVSRDSGRPIVFAGYIALMAGMLIVLGTRIAEGRRAARQAA